MQDPAPRGSSLSAWLFIPLVDRAPARFDYKIQSWDLAITQSYGSSYSACVTFGILRELAYVIDVERFKLESLNLQEVIKAKARHWKPDSILLETSGVGEVIYQALQRDLGNLMRTKPKTSKLERLMAIEDKLRAGRLIVVKEMRGYSDYRNEWISFPGGRYDDQVDATTQFMLQIDVIVAKTSRIAGPRRATENPYKKIYEGLEKRRQDDRIDRMFGSVKRRRLN
jgi:predicted phage terminase large subunit-like protein